MVGVLENKEKDHFIQNCSGGEPYRVWQESYDDGVEEQRHATHAPRVPDPEEYWGDL